MKTIRRLRLRNWMSYRGDHELILESKSYAVVARHLRDAERSNWLGKSALFEAIDFALRGALNPDRHMDANGWITDGEKDGHVNLVFDDGLVLTRSRKIGQSTQLVYGNAKGDEAQAAIAQNMGVTSDDFATICYFRQRQMAQFILSRPEERMSYARAWFKLAPLEAGEDRAQARASSIADKVDILTREVERQVQIECEALAGHESIEELEAIIARDEQKLEKLKDKRQRLQELLGKNASLLLATRIVAEYEATFQHHSELLDKQPNIPKLQHDAEQAAAVATKLHESMTVARRDVEQKDQLSRGEFDGRCPIAEMQCPVAGKIKENKARNSELLSASQVVYATKRATWERADADAREKRAKLQEAASVQERINELAARLTRTRDEYTNAKKQPAPADVDDLQVRVNEANSDIQTQALHLQELHARIDRVLQSRKAREALAADLRGLQERLSTCREASVIFGKNGAQRRVAEGALAAIQDGANAMLQDCGINLSVEVSWGREGAGPAKTCDTCGAPFPSSTKVKKCRCGADRGPLIKNRLDILLSEQSGAAEDLAGIAVQFSASAWLRRKRGAQWSVALIDEPVSQLDAAHRRMLSNHLAALLSSRYSFEQAFVTAHHSSVLDALPGRIEVVSDGKYSTLRIAA